METNHEKTIRKTSSVGYSALQLAWTLQVNVMKTQQQTEETALDRLEQNFSMSALTVILNQIILCCRGLSCALWDI